MPDPGRLRDVVVVGGGPAGLAAAAAAAAAGLDVLLLERGALPADKACGEGLLPAGVAALESLGALRRLGAAERWPIRAIRWIDATAPLPAQARALLPGGGGLGIRRTALSLALLEAARAAGAEVREGSAVRAHRRSGQAVEVETAEGTARARLLVAADGLHSPIREREGLSARVGGGERFGLRRHFALAPWGEEVEVHLGDDAEAYVTPCGPRRVGVALLFEARARAPYPELLARFPTLAGRLSGAPSDSPLAGAGPFLQPCRRRAADRLVLLGDAAGFVDAITGEGLSLALLAARDLGAALPEALASGASRRALSGWERQQRGRYRRYAATTRLLLALTRRPAARRRILAAAGRHPGLLSGAVGWAVG